MDPLPPRSDPPSSETPSEESTARLEALLFSEELLPVPLGLLARVRDAVRNAPPAPYEDAYQEDRAEAVEPGPQLRPLPLPRPLRLPRRRSLAKGVAAAVLVAVGAGLTYAGVEPVAAAGEALRDAGVPAEFGLSRRPVVEDAVLRPWTASWSTAWTQPPDVTALARVPVAVPGGPVALASLALVFLGSGLGLACAGPGSASRELFGSLGVVWFWIL